MRVVEMRMKGTWREVADSARTTVGKDAGTGEPPGTWKRKILLAEHSPIRQLLFHWKWVELPSWVSVHFVRHKVGIEHWVRTQRTDRTGIDRNTLSQGALVEHECEANAQAMITISRKRLCRCASNETQAAWDEVAWNVHAICPELAELMVPECVYRGFCPEIKCCGYVHTSGYVAERDDYKGVL